MELKFTHARVSFANGLFTASAQEEGQTKKFSADFIKEESTTVHKKVDGKWVPTTMDEAMLEVANNTWKGKGKEMLADLEASKKSYRDGNKRKSKAGEVYAGYAGHMYVTAKNELRPTVVDRKRNPVLESDGTIYSGCYVNVIFELYGIADPKRKGVFAELRGVQFNEEGESFGGGGVAKADAFEDLGAPEGDSFADMA